MSTKKDMPATDYLKAKAANDKAVENLPQDKAKHDAKLERQYHERNKQGS